MERRAGVRVTDTRLGLRAGMTGEPLRCGHPNGMARGRGVAYVCGHGSAVPTPIRSARVMWTLAPLLS